MITDYRAGSVFILDYGQFQFEQPEMVKRRMVVVMAADTIVGNGRLKSEA